MHRGQHTVGKDCEAHSDYHKIRDKAQHRYIPFPPSTSMLLPVMNLPSSLARNKAVLATSSGSVNLPKGTYRQISPDQAV